MNFDHLRAAWFALRAIIVRRDEDRAFRACRVLQPRFKPDEAFIATFNGFQDACPGVRTT